MSVSGIISTVGIMHEKLLIERGKSRIMLSGYLSISWCFFESRNLLQRGTAGFPEIRREATSREAPAGALLRETPACRRNLKTVLHRHAGRA
ncbi:hypothetical protein [Stappia sp. ES.058]|uniref:hypothetical protein n=1 Tax=Stappia sp. ES.058 TaxID=1881061 RepID=UPI0012FD023A|nr:hypothetical protein [Stappia sp. ES.058]